MRENAISIARAINWENIMIQYCLLIDQLTNRKDDLKFNFPIINLDNIKKITTDLGIFQFSKFSQSDPESGYTLDDNAKALINMVNYNKAFLDNENLKLANIYLNFIEGI